MSERTFCKRGGSIVMWRADERSDGSPSLPFFRAPQAVLVLDHEDGCPWLMVHALEARGASVDSSSLAPMPHVGAMATVLSAMVDA